MSRKAHPDTPVRQALIDATDDLVAWWSSETDTFRTFVLGLLAALPGGEQLDFVEPPYGFGWKELHLICNLFTAIQDASDVRYVVRRIIRETDQVLSG